MKKRRWSDGWFAAALVLTSLHCAAQDSFRYRAQVDTPHETDFYRIVCSPEVVARSKTDLSDLTVGISAMQAGRRPVLTANRTNSQTRRRIPALEHPLHRPSSVNLFQREDGRRHRSQKESP